MKTGRASHLLFATFFLLQGILFRPASHAQDLRDYQKSLALNSLVSEINDRVQDGWNGRQLAELQQDLTRLEAVRTDVDQHKFLPWKASTKLTLAGLYIQLARISQGSCILYLDQAVRVLDEIDKIGMQIELNRYIKLDTYQTKANWGITKYLCDVKANPAADYTRFYYNKMLEMPSLSDWPGRRGIIQLEIAVLMHVQAPWIRGFIINNPNGPPPPAPNRQEERTRLDGILKQIAMAEPDMSRPGAATDNACTLKRERGNIIVWAVTGGPLADDPEVAGPMLENAMADLRQSKGCSKNRSSIRTPYVPSAIADALVFRAVKTGSVADATEALDILLNVEERVTAGEQELIADQRSNPPPLPQTSPKRR